METINHITAQIFDSIILLNSTQLAESLVQILTYLEPRMSKCGLPIIKPIEQMVTIFLRLNPLLVSPFHTRVIEKIGSGKDSKLVERMEETTFKEIFLTYIKAKDYHTCTIKGVEFSCGINQESLFCHLIITMVSSVWYLLITNPETTNHYAQFIGALGLLHDIGKPGTMTTETNKFGDKTKHIIKFPTHGLIGGIILQKAYNADFGFSLEEWDVLCRCTTIHMSGYDLTNNISPITQIKWLRLNLESPQVKHCLLYLSVGDYIGNVKNDDLIADEEFFKSRESFVQILESKISEPVKIFTKLGTSGLIIVIAGACGAGKSTLAKQLVEYLTSREIANNYISADDIMFKMICPILELEVGHTAESYDQCSKYVKLNDMDKEINLQIKQQISNSIVFGEVCIIDIEASMNRKVFNTYFSDEVLSCEILQIIVERNIKHTSTDTNAKSHNLTLEHQIELSGLSHLMNPFAKIDSANITGLSSVMESWNIKRDSGNRAQCTLTASIVWTPEYTFGMSHVYQLLNELSPGLKREIVKHIDTQSMNVVEYVNYLYELYECEPSLPNSTQYKLKFDALVRRFSVLNFTVSTPYQLRDSEYKSRVFSIKYQDGINRLWRPIWARQCRGVCFFVKEDFTCVPIKYQLQRGAELMSGMLVSANIASTQDISDAKKIAILSDSQQKTCMILLAGENEGKFDAHLTEKVDGSLLTITFYYGESALLMKAIITEFGDKFSQMILAGFEALGVVGVVSTQGTLMMGYDMQDYFVTSILESPIIGLRRETICKQIMSSTPSSTPTQLFIDYGKPWFTEMVRVLDNLPIPEIPSSPSSPYPSYPSYPSYPPILNISLCWESVCANRNTAWGKLHTELAIEYSSSMCLFLGASWCGDNWVINVPHTMLNIESVDEPRYWITKSASEVDRLMRGLEDVVYGKISSLDFLIKYTPSAKSWNSSLPLHPEGYVCYTKEDKMFGLPVVDYNKLKLPAYYIGHKFHDKSIEKLYELSKTASNIFPMAKIVGDFYSGIENKFYAIGKRLCRGLSPGPDNIFVSGLEGKAIKAYQNASAEVQVKMIINAGTNIFDTWIKNLATEYYPSIATTDLGSTIIKSGLKRMCMDLKPWVNYNSETVPTEFQEIIANPIKFSGIGSIFLMLIHQVDSSEH